MLLIRNSSVLTCLLALWLSGALGIAQYNPFQSIKEFDEKSSKPQTYDTVEVNDLIMAQELALRRSMARDSAWSADRHRPSVFMRVGMITGPGKARMEFNTLYDERVTHRRYEADIFSSWALGLEAGLRYKGWAAGVVLGSGIMMYSDYLEYYTRIDPNSGQEITNYTTHGDWPSGRLSYGAFAEYGFRLSRDLRLSLFGQYSRYRIRGDHYFIRSIPRSVAGTFTDTWMAAAGTRLRFLTGNRHALYLSFAYQSSWFNALPYFDDADPGSYEMSFNQYLLGLGFEFLPFKK
ncbi:MAG TPA: hypothetical protein P5550_01760 [Bacteroidales bacterium]|nr:hypothetical protein [Bacteroidales bacterium]